EACRQATAGKIELGQCRLDLERTTSRCREIVEHHVEPVAPRVSRRDMGLVTAEDRRHATHDAVVEDQRLIIVEAAEPFEIAKQDSADLTRGRRWRRTAGLEGGGSVAATRHDDGR